MATDVSHDGDTKHLLLSVSTFLYSYHEGGAAWLRVQEEGTGGDAVEVFVASSPLAALRWMLENDRESVQVEFDRMSEAEPDGRDEGSGAASQATCGADSGDGGPEGNGASEANEDPEGAAEGTRIQAHDNEEEDGDREEPRVATRDDEPVAGRARGAKKRCAYGEVPAPKKRKRSTSKAKEEKMLKDMNLMWARTWASSQEREKMSDTQQVLTDEQRAYGNYMQRLPGVGLTQAEEMIKRAAVIGSVESLEDWSRILGAWRRRSHGNEAMCNAGTAMLHLTNSPHEPGEDAEQAEWYEWLEDSEDVERVIRFRSLFFAVANNEGLSFASDILHRWRLAAFFEEAEAIEARLRETGFSSGLTGVGVASEVRERLFSMTFRWRGEKEESPRDSRRWKDLERFLTNGKRWHMLKRAFGPGVFAIIPKSRVPNRFVERTLTLCRLDQWIDMIQTCNAVAVGFCSAAESLLLRLVNDQPPPTKLLGLELVEDWTTLTGDSPTLDLWRETEQEARPVLG